MALITYDDKSNMYQYPSIPTINKITSADMNEIKSVINSNYAEEKSDIASFFYKSGDEIEIGGTDANTAAAFAGFISGNSLFLITTIYTPKRLDNISLITVDSLNVEARGVSGAVNSQTGYYEYVGRSGYTITPIIVSENAITIKIQKSSAYTNVVANSPMCLNGYIKMTLG